MAVVLLISPLCRCRAASHPFYSDNHCWLHILGSRFGAVDGTLTLFVSALITGGVGPVAAMPDVCCRVGRCIGWLVAPGVGWESERRRVGSLPFWFYVGPAFGLLINLYILAVLAIEADMAWQNGITVGTAIARYLVFYVATSLVWDVVRAVGNAVLIAVLGAATLRALARFHDPFSFV